MLQLHEKDVLQNAKKQNDVLIIHGRRMMEFVGWNTDIFWKDMLSKSVMVPIFVGFHPDLINKLTSSINVIDNTNLFRIPFLYPTFIL